MGTLLQRGEVVGRFCVSNLSASGALLTGTRDVESRAPVRLVLQLEQGGPLSLGAMIRRKAIVGDVVALAVGFRQLSPASEDRIHDAVLALLDARFRRDHPAVLVVDASEGSRHDVALRVAALGYRVIECAAPLEALRRLEDPDEPVGAVIARDGQAANPGPELLEWVADTHPEARAILLVEDRTSDPAASPGVHRCHPEQLAAMLD